MAPFFLHNFFYQALFVSKRTIENSRTLLAGYETATLWTRLRIQSCAWGTALSIMSCGRIQAWIWVTRHLWNEVLHLIMIRVHLYLKEYIAPRGLHVGKFLRKSNTKSWLLVSLLASALVSSVQMTSNGGICRCCGMLLKMNLAPFFLSNVAWPSAGPTETFFDCSPSFNLMHSWSLPLMVKQNEVYNESFTPSETCYGREMGIKTLNLKKKASKMTCNVGF